MWDRELGCEVASLPHEDVVNSVAFCPRDQEVMVSGGDDHKYVVTTVQVSRSHRLLSGSKFGYQGEEREKQNRNRNNCRYCNCLLRSEIVIIK